MSRTSVCTCIPPPPPPPHTHTHSCIYACTSTCTCTCTYMNYVHVHAHNYCRIIYSNCKKHLKGQEIIHKRYIISDHLYIFGPLHASKNRERYKEGQHPENMEKLTISNAGKIIAEVSFFFRDDTNGTTYLLDPATMTLNPGESQVIIFCHVSITL